MTVFLPTLGKPTIPTAIFFLESFAIFFKMLDSVYAESTAKMLVGSVFPAKSFPDLNKVVAN